MTEHILSPTALRIVGDREWHVTEARLEQVGETALAIRLADAVPQDRLHLCAIDTNPNVDKEA